MRRGIVCPYLFLLFEPRNSRELGTSPNAVIGNWAPMSGYSTCQTSEIEKRDVREGRAQRFQWIRTNKLSCV